MVKPGTGMSYTSFWFGLSGGWTSNPYRSISTEYFDVRGKKETFYLTN
jgi:hypothetical protein